jgi:mRNA interferase MazF
MRRGDVFWADVGARDGSAQAGRRPVIVISHDGFNEVPTWRSIIVVPVTTSEAQTRRGPTAVPLAVGTAGLKQASVAVCHQVATLDRSKLADKIGTLSADALARVETGLRVALDLE